MTACKAGAALILGWAAVTLAFGTWKRFPGDRYALAIAEIAAGIRGVAYALCARGEATLCSGQIACPGQLLPPATTPCAPVNNEWWVVSDALARGTALYVIMRHTCSGTASRVPRHKAMVVAAAFASVPVAAWASADDEDGTSLILAWLLFCAFTYMLRKIARATVAHPTSADLELFSLGMLWMASLADVSAHTHRVRQRLRTCRAEVDEELGLAKADRALLTAQTVTLAMIYAATWVSYVERPGPGQEVEDESEEDDL